MKKLIAILAAGTMAAGVSAAAKADIISLDGDGDGLISAEEFTGYDETRSYEYYDEDGDGMISDVEYRRGNFRRYDRDRDGYWNEEEIGMFEEDEGLFD